MTSKKLENRWKHFKMCHVNRSGLPKKCRFWQKRTPKNDETPSTKISQIMDIRPISIKKHEWNFPKMVQVSITKHKMTFWGTLKFCNLGILKI